MRNLYWITAGMYEEKTWTSLPIKACGEPELYEKRRSPHRNGRYSVVAATFTATLLRLSIYLSC